MELYHATGLPPAQGLYDPRNEHDNCGLGFVVNIKGVASHEIVSKGIQILINLTHRGACGCDPETGDGAGVLIQIPHKFYARECSKLGFTLPLPGEYGMGLVFLPVEHTQRLMAEGIVERVVEEEGLSVIGWRDTPVFADAIGRVARASQPYIEQVFIRRAQGMDEDTLERKLYIIRKRAEMEIRKSEIRDQQFYYIPSLSCRKVVYKGLLLAPQIEAFYSDLSDPDTMSAMCLVHQRFSTNTFPTWPLAHPYRYVCHNGEINTVRGNANWMYARQSVMSSPVWGDDIKKLFPIIEAGGSDSAMLDNAVELLTLSGRSLPHVMAMLMPEAWDGDVTMHPDKKAFYEYHASMMEPWDGPAAVAFTDGRLIGATLDRNGLRPARYLVTHDDTLIMASETGVLEVKPEDVKFKGRLQPAAAARSLPRKFFQREASTRFKSRLFAFRFLKNNPKKPMIPLIVRISLTFSRIGRTFNPRRFWLDNSSRNVKIRGCCAPLLAPAFRRFGMRYLPILIFSLLVSFFAEAQPAPCPVLPAKAPIPASPTQSATRAALAAALNHPDVAAKKQEFAQALAKLESDPTIKAQGIKNQQLISAVLTGPDLAKQKLQMASQVAASQNAGAYQNQKAAFLASSKCIAP